MGLELIGLDCSAEHRRHYVEDQHHAEVLASDEGGHLFRTICGRVIAGASLSSAPEPLCPGCHDLAHDRRATATAAVSPTRRRRLEAGPLEQNGRGRRWYALIEAVLGDGPTNTTTVEDPSRARALGSGVPLSSSNDRRRWVANH